MARNKENTGFVCCNCGLMVLPVTNGSYRNHCPGCLCSLHVDHEPGDRANCCKGVMHPTGLVYRGHKGWQVVHRCNKCGHRSVNRMAADTVQPDDLAVLTALSGRKG